ncbi:HD domain-containing phosphohydrolase [Rhodoferax sp.]|uniref:HD domain-containing phosphohydrolase n=1 Tax=Rhodoferax sp. TaxID=50421 RepID=UPI0028507281|nr:HD domain-containing phosphohydrolase [Rhodoferax sp.]MDR3368803.1 response regulator [Rhodoferax sp.]
MNSRSRILIVDDDLGNIELIGQILGAEYDISFASSGKEGLELAMGQSSDLILLDVVMPGIDGFTVCRQLKANAATRDIPVIFLTSLESAVDEEFGLSLGAEDFIHKPVSPPVMLARVRNHLLLANTKRELKRHIDELELLVAERTREIVFRDRQLIATQSATITAFCALAEARDNETGNHIKRTQNYVRLLAEELSDHPRFRQVLDKETIQLLYKSAPLHDVGKVAIPDAILLKPGKLTPQEWVIMKRHCVAGRDAIVAAANELVDCSGSYLSYAAEIAYCHHERWDGSGYPRGIHGDDIPFSARLMAVADVYDALISKRVYKGAYSHEESVHIMARERGSHFDPDVFDAMLSIADSFDAIANRYRDDLLCPSFNTSK